MRCRWLLGLGLLSGACGGSGADEAAQAPESATSSSASSPPVPGAATAPTPSTAPLLSLDPSPSERPCEACTLGRAERIEVWLDGAPALSARRNYLCSSTGQAAPHLTWCRGGLTGGVDGCSSDELTCVSLKLRPGSTESEGVLTLAGREWKLQGRTEYSSGFPTQGSSLLEGTFEGVASAQHAVTAAVRVEFFFCATVSVCLL
jgi:hypothetical protein